MSSSEIRKILKENKTIAVVGLSRYPEKESREVASYLKENGYKIIPVNPYANKILGEKSYANLLEIPLDIQKQIEIVDIFRPAKDVAPIVDQAIKIRKKFGIPHVIWMQKGIVNEQVANTARNAGLTVVMDKCIKQEHTSIS